MPLYEWNRTAATSPSSSGPHDGVVVHGRDAVVGLGSPADDGGVDHMREQEQDDGDAGDAVEQPGVLALVALVDGAVVAALLASVGSPRWIPPSLSRAPRGHRAEPANGRAESTHFRPRSSPPVR